MIVKDSMCAYLEIYTLELFLQPIIVHLMVANRVLELGSLFLSLDDKALLLLDILLARFKVLYKVERRWRTYMYTIVYIYAISTL